MNHAELFGEGISLMIAGMGFVLFFLFILIYAISFISILINKYFPEPLPEATPTKPTTAAPTDDLSRLHPVIVAAIAHHRKMQGL